MKFFLLLDPPTVTAQEKKIVVVKGKPRIYQPDNVRTAKETLLKHLRPFKPEKPITGPVKLVTVWYFETCGKHKDNEYRITKPDTDNLQKMLKDCMTQVGFWKDDAQVCIEHVEKVWSEDTPGIDITIYQTAKKKPSNKDENESGNRRWRGLSNYGNDPENPDRKNYCQEGLERLAAAIIETAVNDYRDYGFKLKELEAKYKAKKITKKHYEEKANDCRWEMNACRLFFKSERFANISTIDSEWLIETLDKQIEEYVPDISGGGKCGRI